MFERFLEEIGLSEKEAKVYLALLEVDSDTINDLAKKTGINRTTVYPVLESLSKKGLVSEVQKGKITTFSAEPPERLETFMERQKALLTERANRLKDVVPQLKSIQRETGERPIIKYFEGRDGAISAYEEFYEMHDKKTKEGYFIYNDDLKDQTFNEAEQDKFLKIRLGKNVRPISIYNKQDGYKEFKTPGTRIRIDEKKYPILADISIIEDRIIATSLTGNISSVVIKSKDIATTLESLVKFIIDNEKRGGK